MFVIEEVTDKQLDFFHDSCFPSYDDTFECTPDNSCSPDFSSCTPLDD